MEGGIQAVHAEIERVMNINNEVHRARVRTFAKETFPKMTAKDSAKHPRQAFECCLAFCKEKATASTKTHDETTQLSFVKFMKKYRFYDADSFGQALIDILEEKANEGRTIVFPSFNEVHSKLVEESETILRLKRELKKKEEEIIQLKEDLKHEVGVNQMHKELFHSIKRESCTNAALADGWEKHYEDLKEEFSAYKGHVNIEGCTICRARFVKFRHERIINAQFNKKYGPQKPSSSDN